MAAIEISSWTELDSIRADLSATASYVLTRSLLKTDADYIGIGDSWVPLGNAVVKVVAECQFDMNGFTIEGLTTTSDIAGLFGQVGFEFCCENGIFDDATITSTTNSGCGVVAGRVLKSSPGWAFRNIRVKNSKINDGVIPGRLFNGGIVGVVGDTEGSVNGNITDGVIEDCSVENCIIGGSTSGTGNFHGGICGFLRGGTIRRCNVRETKIDTISYSGGICVAYGSSLIEDCYVDGISFAGYRAIYSGGIASRNGTGTCTIRRCWVGTVSYSTTISDGNRCAIASVRAGTANVSDCFYDSATTWRDGGGGGTAKTAAEMYQQATFTNWDFDTVWYIQEGEDYPRLRGVDKMAAIEISSWTELDSIRADVSATASYVLTRSLLKTDVDYIGIGDSWVPISGLSGDPLVRCQFDMNGFTIEGLTTTTTSSYTGLFGLVGFEFCCENGIFDDATITSSANSGCGVVAGRVLYLSPGWAFRKIRVKNSSVNDGVAIILNGGIVGIAGDARGPNGVNGNITDGVIEDCSVENCRIGGSSDRAGAYNGSIAGWLRGGTIRRCASVGNKVDTGGLSGGSFAGGICHALGSSLIEDCYVDDLLAQGYKTTYFGGIASRTGDGTCTIRRCWVGGVSFSTTVSGGYRRAIASVNAGTTNVSDCFYDSATTWRDGGGGGTAKTAAEMYQQATFTNWDFDNVWYIQEGEDYPRLLSIDTPIVPSIVGKTQAAAEGIITAALFTVGTITGEYSDTVPIGVVISQSPVAGANSYIGSAIDFVVSLGPSVATMPNIIGLDIDAADALLLSSLLTTGVVSAVSGVGDLYTVIAQQYPPGTELAIGTSVNYTILVPASDLAGFKTVIGYDNILSRSDVTLTASSTAVGTFVENVADGNTYDYWQSGKGVS